MQNKPLTATEVRRLNAEYWVNFNKNYPEVMEAYEKAQAAFFGPIIDKLLQIMAKKSKK